MDTEKAKADAKRASAGWRARIGAGIRAARTKARYSQAELAALIGVDLSTVSGIERGEQIPNYATVESMADILACSIDELVGRTRFLIEGGVVAAGTAAAGPSAPEDQIQIVALGGVYLGRAIEQLRERLDALEDRLGPAQSARTAQTP